MTHFKDKNRKLEKLRGIFFQVGLIVAGGLTLVAFEWTSPNYISTLEGVVVEELESDFPYVEPFEIERDKPKEKIEAPKVKSETFKIVKDDYKEKEADKKKEDDKKELTFDPDLYGEPEPYVDPNPAPLPIAEKMPEFIGGLKKMNEYLGNNINYPSKARKAGIQGKVYVQFVVGKKGEIKNVKVLRGVNKWLDEEAVRVVKAMPNWKPGKQSGKAVSVLYMLPINFMLKG